MTTPQTIPIESEAEWGELEEFIVTDVSSKWCLLLVGVLSVVLYHLCYGVAVGWGRSSLLMFLYSQKMST